MQNTEYLKLNMPELVDKANILKLSENMIGIDDVVETFNEEHAEIERRLLRLELNAGVIPEQALADALESIRREVSLLREKVYVVSGEFEELTEKQEHDIEVINGKIDDLQEQIDEIIEKITIVVDDELSLTSENPVQNKVIAGELNEIVKKFEGFDSAVSDIVKNISGISKNVSDINTSITNINANISAANTNISNLSEEVTNIDNTVTMIDEYFTLVN